MQMELFEAADRATWSQLPEDVRERVVELLARCVLECLGHIARESEVDDDR